MAEGKHQKFQKFQDQWSSPNNKVDPMMIMNEDEKDSNNSIDAASSSVSSIDEDSTISNGSCSSSNDTRDDASSSATCSSNSSSNSSEALYDLSDLMAQLPLKRGLSKFYQGKSESFTCLSKVTSIEDLAKKESSPYNRRRKNKGISKSFEGGLDAYKSFTRPKANISKRNPKASVSSSFLNRRGSFSNGSSRPPLIPSEKELVR